MSAPSSEPVTPVGHGSASTGSASTGSASTGSASPASASTVPAEPEDAGLLDLEDRHALRRVAGLSTELQDITEVEYRALRLERGVLMGVWADGAPATGENSLRELSRVAQAPRLGRVAVQAGRRPGGRGRWHRNPRSRRDEDRD